MRLLVVEDDAVVGRALRQGFEEAGHECTLASTGDKGLGLASSGSYDAIVLDLLLPGKGGQDVLKELRAAGDRTPVVVLTALGSIEERVQGLRVGADDYVVKPFAFAELMARIEAVCRRTPRPSPVARIGDLTLDLTNRTVTRGGNEVELTPTEFSLLEFLMRHAGHVVTRKMLCTHLWESDWEGTTNVIEVHINRLRNKIGRGFEDTLIETVRGRGYVLRAT